MTNIRRRSAKERRVPESMVVPGARAHLIASEYEYALDPRTTPPTLHRDLLDPLEANESVEVDLWQLPGDLWRTFGGLDDMNTRVRVDADDTVTVIHE
jgi:hypothetical protein